MGNSEVNDQLWAKALDLIRDQISSANYKIWFSPTTQESANGKLVVNVPSAFVKNQLTSKYLNLISSTVASIVKQELPIEFLVNPAKTQQRKKVVNEDSQELFEPINQGPSPEHFGLNPKYNLNSFMVGLSNNLAYAAAQAVIQNPGTTYNPLFIYGGTGVGKTHLMQAVGNALLKRSANIKIVYCSSEKFTNDYVQSIQNKRTGDFRARYRLCDLLLIDDIQFISGRDSTQEEFFHTFNELHTKNAQIILTSDRPPQEMLKMESRLISRFQGGLMVDIQLPDRDTRVAILRAKCQERGEAVPEACIELLAETVVSNARELEGKLIQIIQLNKLQGLPVTLESVQAFLGKAPASPGLKADPKKVLTVVNQFFNLKLADLTGPRRKKELVLPRQIAMFVLYEDCRVPYERIGQMLGGRDHTTIMHGVEKIGEAQNRDREVQRLVIEVRQLLSQ